MTTATLPSGIDGLAVRFGQALVKWGRVRAERAAISRDQHSVRLDTEHTIEAREHASHRYGIAA